MNGPTLCEHCGQAMPKPVRHHFGCGHPLTEANTQMMGGQPKCRLCNRERSRKAMAARRAEKPDPIEHMKRLLRRM